MMLTVVLLNKENVERRLFKKRRILSNGCWNWTGYKRTRTPHVPYGVTRFNNKNYAPHRLMASLYLKLDLKNPKMCACHKCDNSLCFNPKHLFVGTYKENNQDMVNKKRYYRKLQDHQVKRLRWLHSRGLTYIELSKIFSLDTKTVRDIALKYYYKDID